MSPAASTRWCPTPEQLMILEEMYRGGIRTPNATQIQQITAHLSFYGKIEGKNVFYWFQNHKARERQKLRRKLSRQQQQQQQQQYPHHHFLHQIDPSDAAAAALQQIPLYNSTQIVPQIGGLKESSSNDDIERSTRMYGRDWMMMMMDVGPATPCCNRPLKTLQLFPITTSSSLKDECTTSDHLSCSTSSD
ncbi:PREDICTED: WUSCHEL-related homeobox 3A [Nelumbo nucifera]|uniref:WUSCHEL-related homeobox 3A n=2 Tax=Nelumbo nucifera TaxID=4432 RepID=A0A1U7ZNQ6_NELNU|nr:PREDICTED: WUSCHEL-related homeobox 3A [Nelumbo nucifera]DAD26001.1 TPA_asm: hypothetical protein HUJ06_027469 [Nelumbo nucifera]